jgi:molybdenum cofactor biosynthesis protein B
MGVEAHGKASTKLVRFGIISLSDSRTLQEDFSGDKAQKMLTEGGHPVVSRTLIPDEPSQLAWALRALVGHADAALLIGGTGISPRDSTYDTLRGLYAKELFGFGELFRQLSFNQIGQAAILSRASAGVFMGMLVVSLPGSIKAIELALADILLPEVGHMLYEMRKVGPLG